MSCNDDQAVEVEGVKILQLLDSSDYLPTHLETFYASEAFFIHNWDHCIGSVVIFIVVFICAFAPSFLVLFILRASIVVPS